MSSLGVIYLVLWLHGYASRGLQTITATLGVDIVLGLAQLPFKFLASTAGNQTNMLALFYLGSMVIFIWELAVYSNLFRHALSTSIFRAGGYALLLFILNIYVNYQMIPVTG